MAVNDLWIIAIKTNTVSDPEGTTVVQTLKTGTTVKEAEQRDMPTSGIWIKCQAPHSGWFLGIAHSQDKIDEYLAAHAPADSTVADAATDVGNEADEEAAVDVGSIDDFDDSTQLQFSARNITHNIGDSEFTNIKNVAGVFGLPYQFLPTTDPRIVAVDEDNKVVKSSSSLGYEYSNRIVERMPLLFIAPGRPAFLSKHSKKETDTLIESLLSQGILGSLGDSRSSLEELIMQGGRYYTFEYANSEYYTYVNPLCRAMAIYLGIEHIKLPGANTTLNKMNWEDFTTSGIKSITDFGNWRSLPFYIDTDTSISESWSNSTTQSQLASTVGSVSDMAREINYLVGMGGAALDVDTLDADTTSNFQNVENIIDKITGKGMGGFISNLGDHLSVIATGGRMIFPEIWADSTFSRSYNCRFKFVSPDPSNLSIYLNVLVPLIHLMGLVAPQTLVDSDGNANVNTYCSPFLVRAIYKGMFNVDMGIITSMSVTKGGDAKWTKNGIPTSIEVDIEIKDLYNAMSITASPGTLNPLKAVVGNSTLNNTALMDYLANLCGINVYKPEIRRSIEMWYTLNLQNRAGDFFQNNIWGNIQDKIQNLIMGIYR